MTMRVSALVLLACGLAGCGFEDSEAPRRRAALTPLPLPENFDPKAVSPAEKRRVYEQYTVSIDAAQRCSNRIASELILESDRKNEDRYVSEVLGRAYDGCPDEWRQVAVARQERQKVDGTTAYPLEGMVMILRSNYIEQFTPFYTNKKIPIVPGGPQRQDILPEVEEKRR